MQGWTPKEKQKLIDEVTPLAEKYAPFIDAVNSLREAVSKEGDERPAELTAEFANEDMPAEFDLTAILSRVMIDAPSEEGSPESVPLVTYDVGANLLKVRGDVEATPEMFDQVIAPINYQGFIEALEKVYTAASRLGYKQQVIAQLKGNPENTGVKKLQKIGEIKKYKDKLALYEKQLANAKQDYDYDHLEYSWKEIQSLRASLVGPIKSLDADLKKAAQDILTLEQMERGSVPKPWTALRISDTLTILGLACLGLMLIFGLFTRFAAAAAAFMLFSFYMAMPPLPGLPELPGPEHSLIVNKNLIEVFALAAIAALPTGLWFGLDSFIAWFFAGSKEN